jgi:type VI secretion system protein ImpE
MSASEHFQAGRLREALAAQTEEVRQNPDDAGRRAFLAELLCFAGNLDRADKQLDAIAHQNPKLAVGISLFRQLVRAEQARQQFYTDGRLPEFVGPLSAVLHLHLEASIRLREGQAAEALKLLAEAEEQRPKLSGVCDGQPFQDLRDLDDLTAPLLEVLATNGKYYWVPLERIERVTFHAPSLPRDLLWRRAHLTCRGGGPDGEVCVPVLYPGAHAEADDSLRLGRMTDWREGSGGPVRGVGQRTFLVGSADRPVLELKEITIDSGKG